jgi:serine kinase of HPr protein (carbohydrate metabolism regulator)
MSNIDPVPGPRLSAETVHASTVAVDGRAVLITGPSGSGKSDLALRLLDRGFSLVSGIGIVQIEHVSDVPVALIVELTSDIQRLPDDSRERPILGVKLPLITTDAMTASAPSKVALALDRMGLKFK